MEKIVKSAVPFLTRFFRAWADDLKLPDTDPPKKPEKPEDE
jgi:hypothetical protein